MIAARFGEAGNDSCIGSSIELSFAVLKVVKCYRVCTNDECRCCFAAHGQLMAPESAMLGIGNLPIVAPTRDCKECIGSNWAVAYERHLLTHNCSTFGRFEASLYPRNTPSLIFVPCPIIMCVNVTTIYPINKNLSCCCSL